MRGLTELPKMALALLVTMALSLSLATAVWAQDSPEATITIDSVSLEGREIVVTGTVTCPEAEAGDLNVSVNQGEASALVTYYVRCSPGEGTPYEARISASDDLGFAAEFGGGQVEVGVSFASACQRPEGGACSSAAVEGTFTVEGPPPGESPAEVPETGAGGLATGVSVPWGSLGLAASGLLAAGYAVLRRR